jgi:hypothetical protein
MTSAIVGRLGYLTYAQDRDKSGLLSFQVRILDVRERYGRRDYLVEPIAGWGQRWVEDHRVKLVMDTADDPDR